MPCGGELRPLCRFSLFSLAVLRWTGSRWGPLVLPLWIAAGSELLRVMTLACGWDLESFLSSVFGKKALRPLVNLARPSPRFRKAFFGGTWTNFGSFWFYLSQEKKCGHSVNSLLFLFSHFFYFHRILKPKFKKLNIAPCS